MIEPRLIQPSARKKVERSRWKISVRRIVDLFTIIICAAVLIRCGFKVSHWWKPETVNGLESSPKTLFFQKEQQFPLIRLEEKQRNISNELFAGNEVKVIDELKKRCRLQLSKKEVLKENISIQEAELLNKLLASQPVVEFSDIWKVYHLKERLPSVVGIKKESSAGNHWRVIFWSMAIPLEESKWSLWSLNPKNTANEDIHDRSFSPGVDHNVTMISKSGEKLTFFSGNGEIEQCIQDLDQHYHNLNWKKIRDLKQKENRKLLRYISPNFNETVDIIFYKTKMNQVNGIQMVKQNRSASINSNE